MKTRLLICGLLFITGISLAQKYKVKKDVLYKDKVVMGKVTGKVKEFTVFDNNDAPILRANQGYFKGRIPGQKDILWMDLEFPALDKKVRINSMTYWSVKHFLNVELFGKGVHLYDDGFNTNDIDTFVDVAETVRKDTMEVVEVLNYYNVALSKLGIPKKPDASLYFEKIYNSRNYWIYQIYRNEDDEEDEKRSIKIGKMEFSGVEDRSIGSSTGRGKKVNEMKIYRKLIAEVTGPDSKYLEYTDGNFLLAATIDLNDALGELYLYQNGEYMSRMKYEVETRDKSEGTIGKSVANWMFSHGYL
ncbi:hypothetical protein LVD15_14075 [Fulvivirga maritima]|uniref:hypothetical protein n=1 Tax=Fulvivirga maritima TaxID=2904247 RepID=UPI001F267BDE|nr:hypothetical protein [Fulvivirga maritima]UII24450.1 hypothetical protein LVD15_14075 [Fulvivirga maritima]